MADPNNLSNIIERILNGSQTKDDIEEMRRLLSDREVISQLGKYNVYIGEGQDIHIGDRTYYTWNDEALRALVCKIRFGESIEPKIREKQDYYQNEIRKINNHRKEELYQLKTKYQDDLIKLEMYYHNNLSRIETEHINTRCQEINRILSILKIRKDKLKQQLEKVWHHENYSDSYVQEVRFELEEIKNTIKIFSQRQAILPSHGQEIPAVDEFYREKAIKLKEYVDYRKQELDSNLMRDKWRTQLKAKAEIQRIEKNGREETYRLIVQFYLLRDNYPFSSITLNKLKQFQQELKMQKEEIEAVEKSEITTQPFYQ